MKEHLLYTKQTGMATKDGTPRYATVIPGHEKFVIAKLRILGAVVKLKNAAVWLPDKYDLEHPLMWERLSGKSWGFDYWSYRMWRKEMQEEADNLKGTPVANRMRNTRKN